MKVILILLKDPDRVKYGVLLSDVDMACGLFDTKIEAETFIREVENATEKEENSK